MDRKPGSWLGSLAAGAVLVLALSAVLAVLQPFLLTPQQATEPPYPAETAQSPEPPYPVGTASPTRTAAPGGIGTPTRTATLLPGVTDTPFPEETATPTAAAIPGWCLSPQAGTPSPTPTGRPPLAGHLRVAFLRDGDLWTWEQADPEEPSPDARRLTYSGDLAWTALSDDGSWIAFQRQVGEQAVEIWVMGWETSGADPAGADPVEARPAEARLLVSAERLVEMGGYPGDPAVLPHRLSWVPGRTLLAFNTRPANGRVEEFVADDLWLVNAVQGWSWNILKHGQGGEFVFSPDGSQIALLTPDRLDLVDITGRNRRPDVLKAFHAVGFGEENFYPPVAWAADGRSLRVAVPAPQDAQKPNPEVTIYEVPLRGFIVRPLETVIAFPPSIEFAPDLLRMAFLTWPDLTPNQHQLHLADAAGLESQEIIYRRGPRLEFLGWAPDGVRFAYWLPDTRRLFLGDLCAEPQRIPRTPITAGDLRWVDEQRFLFVGGLEGERELYLGNVEGDSERIGVLGDTIQYDVVAMP